MSNKDTATKWKLVVKVFSARNLGHESSRRKRSLAVRLTLGSVVRETEFVEIINGKAKWNASFEYLCDTRAVDSVIELSLVRIAFLPIPMHRHTAYTSALVACGAFPDHEAPLGWFPMSSLKEEVKLCIFWVPVVVGGAAAAASSSPGSMYRSFGSLMSASSPSLAADASSSSGSWSWRRRPGSGAAAAAVTVSVADLESSFRKLPERAVLLRPQHGVEEDGEDGGGGDCRDGVGGAAPAAATSAACVLRASLEVDVIQARNLLGVNRFTLTTASDPFALVTCRGTKRETDVVKKTLHPVWQRGRFEFGGLEDLDVAQDEVRIVVKDWDRLGKYTDLGEVVVRLDQIGRLQQHDQHQPLWLALQPTIYMKSSNRELGEIQVRFHLISPNHHPHPHPRHLQRDESRLARSQSTAVILPPPPAPPSSVVDTRAARPQLVVRIIQARGLLAMDFGGVSDPYCVVHCKSQTKRSSTVSKTLSPVWDFEHTFGLQHDVLCMNDELRIDIFDNDSVLSDLMDDKLGSVRLPLWSVFEADLGQPKWYTIDPAHATSSQRHECAGEVQLAVRYTNPQANRVDIFKGKVWLLELQVGVLEWRGHNAFSKPHCVVQLASGAKRNKKYRTKPAVNLTWPPERFKFQGAEDVGGVVDTDVLTITMMERRAVVGRLSIDVAHMIDRMGYFDAQGQSFTSWFDMDPPASDAVLQAGSGRRSKRKRRYQDLYGEDGGGGGVGGSSVAGGDEAGADGDDDDDDDDDDEDEDTAAAGSDDERTDDDDDDDEAVAKQQQPPLVLPSVPADGSTSSAAAHHERHSLSGTIKHALMHSPFKTVASAAASAASAAVAVAGPREPSSTFSAHTLAQLRANPPSIRVLIRLVPKGEKRSRVNKKLVVRIDQFTPPQVPMQLLAPPPPLLVYCRCQIGCYVRESAEVQFHGNVLQGNPRFFASFYFQHEIEWLMNEAAKRAAERERNLRRRRRGSIADDDDHAATATATATAPNDQIILSVVDGASHQVLYETRTSFFNVGLFSSSPSLAINQWRPLALPCASTSTSGASGELNASFKLVDVKEELVPLLGHIHMQLVQFKLLVSSASSASASSSSSSSSSSPAFHCDSQLRFVVKYADLVYPSPLFVGDPCPVLTPRMEPIRFPVYNVFQRLTIEVYQSSASSSSGDGGEGGDGGPDLSLPAPPAPLQLLIKKIRNARNKVVDKQHSSSSSSSSSTTKWGSLLGSCTVSLFDLYELEARTVFEEDRGSAAAVEKAFKLPIVLDAAGGGGGGGGALRGTLYVEARCTENGGFAGILAANPHPAVSPEETKPFSLVNLRHETVRLVKVLGWLSAFGQHVGSLLDWNSPKKTASAIVIIVVLCCADWFAAHWLLFFPAMGLIHIINRHRHRMTGQFESEFDASSSSSGNSKGSGGAPSMSTHVRVAMVSCRAKVTMEERGPLQARLCVLDHPKSADARTLGTTALCAFVGGDGISGAASGSLSPPPPRGMAQADFAESRLGYSVKPSKMHRPHLQMWKFADTRPAVPAFDFLLEQCTILESTLITVHLFAGRGLLARDSNGKSDPYVRITLKEPSSSSAAGGGGPGGGAKEERQRSKTRPRTLSPEWNARFVFGDGIKPLSMDAVLHIQVFDVDKTQNEDMGSFEQTVGQWLADGGDGGGGSGPVARQWVKLRPPKDVPADMDVGEICMHVERFSIQSRFQKPASSLSALDDLSPGVDALLHTLTPTESSEVAGGAATTGADEPLAASWKRCGSLFGVELYDRRNQLVGRTLLPLGGFVKSDATRLQPMVDLTVPIEPCSSSSGGGARGGGGGGGGALEVRLKVQLTLPDPKAAEIQAQMNEAKRADSLNPAKKYALLMKSLANAQTQLAAVNNRAERFKNLFNYAHPRRTDLVFNFLVFMCVLLTMMPSRVFLLLFVLFFFTEKFRPMGTMGARFKHLLAQLPTDDDLRVVMQGPACTSKRKVMSHVTVEEEEEESEDEERFYDIGEDVDVDDEEEEEEEARRGTGGRRQLLKTAKSLRGIPFAAAGAASFHTKRKLRRFTESTSAELQSISGADALFSGSLSFAKLRSSSSSSSSSTLHGAGAFDRKFFVVTALGMHGWADREAASLHSAQLHVLKIAHVGPATAAFNANDLGKLQRPECAFVVRTESDGEYVFLASTPGKQNKWIEALDAFVCGGGGGAGRGASVELQ